MTTLMLGTIAHNAPWAISEQIRLFRKNLEDDYELVVFDNSTEASACRAIAADCEATQTRYVPTPAKDHAHHLALNWAARVLLSGHAPFIGFLDHDVFPVKPTSVVPMIDESGFLGIGQRHAPTQHLYLWPGFFFLSRTWLANRPLDFSGIRGELKRDDGDTGSMNWPLFADEDWSKMFPLTHGYKAIREPDSYGHQSWAVELFDDAWVHATNASNWLQVPEPEERERLIKEMLAAC